MSNERMFKELAIIMASLESGIKSIESIGLVVEPDEGIGLALYDTCSRAYRIASDLLEFPSVEIENAVCNELFAATKETVEEVSERIWNEYGKYGSEYSQYSPFNKYASHPPVLKDRNGKFYGYFTINKYKARRADYDMIDIIMDNYEKIRDDRDDWYDVIF